MKDQTETLEYLKALGAVHSSIIDRLSLRVEQQAEMLRRMLTALLLLCVAFAVYVYATI